MAQTVYFKTTDSIIKILTAREGHWFSRGDGFPYYPLVQSISILLKEEIDFIEPQLL